MIAPPERRRDGHPPGAGVDRAERGGLFTAESRRNEPAMIDKTYQPSEVEGRIYAHGRRRAPSVPAGRSARAPSPIASSSRRPTSPARCIWATRSTTRCRTSSCRFERMRGKRRALAAGHRPCRHRHADGGRAAADGAPGAGPARDRPREIPREGLGVEGGIRRHHHQPAQAARRLLRLVARALHHGRGAVARGAQGVRRALPRRA